MLSVPELSERLDVCLNTVSAMLTRQDLSMIRIGDRYYRAREADLEAFMAGAAPSTGECAGRRDAETPSSRCNGPVRHTHLKNVCVTTPYVVSP